MSEWKVELHFEEGTSNKFWRARVDGQRLYVNFGRVGSAGQTQVKDFASTEAALAELEKVAESKRRKGYEDLGGEGAEDEELEQDEQEEEEEVDEEAEEAEEEEQQPPPKAARPAAKAGPAVIDLALLEGGRQVALRLAQDGTSIRTVVVETYDSAPSARAALDRLQESLLAEGYRKVTRSGEL